MSATATTDIAAAVGFLEQRFGEVHTGYAVLGFIKDGATTHGYINLQAPDRWERAAHIIERHIETHDCYAAVGVFKETKRRNPATGRDEFRTTDMIAFVNALYLERDEKPYPDTLPPSSYTVETSDGKYQDYLDLGEHIDAETAGRYLRRLAAAAGLGNQAVDAARLLRLPGTINRKPTRNGEIVTVVTDTGARYRLADFDHLPDVHPKPGPRHTATGDGTIPNGQRNSTLASLAGTMRRRGMGEAAIRAALIAENDARCDPPLDADEVRRIAESVGRYTPAEPVTPRDATGDDDHEQGKAEQTAARRNLTDLGNAERLRDKFGGRIRHCAALDVWLIWDGTRWKRDEQREIHHLGAETVRAIYAEAADGPTAQEREAIAKHATRSEAAARIEAMVSLARSLREIAINAAQLDTDRWALNCLNGTLDLRTGKLRLHNPADLLTKLAPVNYDPDATHPLWERFLKEATGGEKAFAGFLQRAAGYTLAGEPVEEVMFFPHGPGATGKSTFLDALKAALGDYAMTADFEAFLKKRGDGGIRNDIARLAGARFVVSVEIDEGKRLAEGLVKMITGGDTVTARLLYKESFEYRPDFTLWLAANHAPKVDNDDDAMWRRILRLPFTNIVPKEKRDPAVKATLRNPSIAGAAILAWAMRGCLDWQKDGLGIPAVVERATEEYRREMNPVADFVDAYCDLSPQAWTANERLWGAYRQHAENEGEPSTLVQKEFAKHLTTLGCTAKSQRWQGKVVRGWKGIAFKEDDTPRGDSLVSVDGVDGVDSTSGNSAHESLHEGKLHNLPSTPSTPSTPPGCEGDTPPEPEEIVWQWIVAVKAEREFGMPDAVCMAAVRLGCALDRSASAEEEAARLADYLDRHAAITTEPEPEPEPLMTRLEMEAWAKDIANDWGSSPENLARAQAAAKAHLDLTIPDDAMEMMTATLIVAALKDRPR